MKKNVIHGLPTPFTHATSIQYKIPFFQRLLVDKIFTKAIAQEKKGNPRGDIRSPHQFSRKRNAIRQGKGVIMTLNLKTRTHGRSPMKPIHPLTPNKHVIDLIHKCN